MSTPAVFDGDEVWDFDSSSEEGSIDSDAVFQDEEEDEPPSPRALAARSAAQQAASSHEGSGGAVASAESVAALVGRLRVDNLELRKALVEAQREAESAAMAFQKEQAEKRRLQAMLEQVRANFSDVWQRAARNKEEADAEAESSGSRAALAPVAEAEEPPEATPSAPSSAGAAAAAPGAEAEGGVGAGAGGEPQSQSEGEQRIALERQLVCCKIRCQGAIERAESLEALVEYYEDQLKTLNPNFQPGSISEVGRQRLSSGAARSPSEADSASPTTPGLSPHTPSLSPPSMSPPHKEKHHRSGKHRIKKWAGKMFGSGHGSSSSVGDASEGGGAGHQPAAAPRLPSKSEDAARQKEVISCLMAELEKANQKINRYKAKSSKKKKGQLVAEEGEGAAGVAVAAA